MIQYLSVNQILYIHKRLIEKYGGAIGVRDEGLLKSAIIRPQMSVFGKDAYPSLYLKSAVIFYSIINNHPFFDGNKRTAFGAMHMMLLINGYDLVAQEKEAENFCLRVILDKIKENKIAEWIENHSKKNKSKK
ncbi:MAG: hypothetical protein ACD_79C01248G0004 [uncultured bacterium]|nr:MAG: hypothetical protein ACD_79C01248G0004 [uncultured bacterium]